MRSRVAGAALPVVAVVVLVVACVLTAAAVVQLFFFVVGTTAIDSLLLLGAAIQDAFLVLLMRLLEYRYICSFQRLIGENGGSPTIIYSPAFSGATGRLVKLLAAVLGCTSCYKYRLDVQGL